MGDPGRNYLATIRFLIVLQVFTSPFHKYQPRCSDCRTIYDENNATSSQPARGPRRWPREASRNGTTIIVTDDNPPTIDGQQQHQQLYDSIQKVYCDRLTGQTSAQSFQNDSDASMYCVDYQACPKISGETSERIRILSCGLKLDGSIKVCCRMSDRHLEEAATDASKQLQENHEFEPHEFAVEQRATVTSDPQPEASTTRSKLATVIVSDQSSSITDERRVGRKDTSGDGRYVKFPSTCGHSKGLESLSAGEESRIIGGQVSRKDAWPWFALLMVQRRRSGRFLAECGATLISDSFILTAAHCVLEQGKRTIRETRLQVRLGEFDMSKVGDGELDIGVTRVFAHPEFNPKTFKNDIALVKLNRKVSMPIVRMFYGHRVNSRTRKNRQWGGQTDRRTIGQWSVLKRARARVNEIRRARSDRTAARSFLCAAAAAPSDEGDLRASILSCIRSHFKH